MKPRFIASLGVVAIAAILLTLWAISARPAGNQVVEVAHYNLAAGPTAVAAPAGPTTQLVTERYLRRQLDQKTTVLLAPIVAELFSDQHATVVSAGIDNHWDERPIGHVTFRPRYWRGAPLRVSILFDDPNYDTSAGSVTQGTCHERPGAGVATTGEYTTVTNGIDGIIEHRVSKTVTESDTWSMTTNESIELTSGQTLEAGGDFAKVSVSFEEKFGISQEETDRAIRTETSNTVEDVFEVDSHKKTAITFTTNNSVR